MTLSDWLIKNDKQFWVDNPRMRDVKAGAEEALGEKVSLKRIRETREEVCQYWRQKRKRRPSTAKCLSEKQWTNVRNNIIQHRNELQGQSVKFAVYFLRDKGSLASETILANSSTWNECFGPKREAVQ